MSQVSCAPSSNRTDGFPVSGSPIIFSRWLAPQSFQVTDFAHHLVKPTSVMEEVILSLAKTSSGAILLCFL